MAESPPSATYFPLRWESTGDKWWYASPIDCAAANGHYDLVRELIRLDANHLFSLTSLRRLRLLESVWDDNAAKSRSAVARRLLQDSEISAGKRSPLIGAGYGAWLLYTAASAGDLKFVKDLLAGDPLLVFGEGEYGMTDMLYAAARSGIAEVFWTLYDFAAAPRFEGAEGAGDVPGGFKWEVMNRAVHAAARGGNSAVLAELLAGAGDRVLDYRDAYGNTVLHAAAGTGQVEVVKYLITTYDDIVSATDNEGNDALHVAAYKGQLSMVEVLLSASSSSITATNEAGNTLLHMAVAGALSPGFQRLDGQIELVKQLITNRSKFNVDDIINAKNNEGRSVLHTAIIGNVRSDLVEILMAAHYIDVNVRDDHGMTPLDYLRHQPRSSSSEMLIRQLISAGGMSNCQDYSARKAFASHLRTQGAVCSSPGTSFRVLDSEIFKYSGMELMLSGSRTRHRGATVRLVSAPGEISQCGLNGGEEEQGKTMMAMESGLENKKRGGPVENAAKRYLKTMFRWPKTNKKRTEKDDDDDDAESRKNWGSSVNETPIPLRERFLGQKRTLEARSNISSPTNRKKFASAMTDRPNGSALHMGSSSTSLSKTSISLHSSSDKQKGADDMAASSFSIQDEADETPRLVHKQAQKNKLLMNHYLCFGGSLLSVKNPIGKRHRHPSTGNKQPIRTVSCH